MLAAPPLTSAALRPLLLLALLWGGSFVFAGVALLEWPVLAVVLARYGLSAIALWAAVVWRGLPVRRDRPALMAHLGMGVLNNLIPACLIVWAMGRMPSGGAAILNATTPLWAVLLAHMLGVERATGLRVLGVLVGLAGVAAMAGGDPRAAPWEAVAAVLGATLSYALAGLWGRRLGALGIPPLVAAAGQGVVAALLVLPLALWLQPPPAWPSAGAAAALVALALLSTTYAYVLYFRILALAGPVNLMLVTLMIPPFAIGLGWLLLGESVGWAQLAGLALIAMGLALIDGRAFRGR